ncbi:MAG: tetratricopeptide repeat protein [Flavobacteriia bacterium]|nr:tetratricopeptide repeat protein [Flavobacteriia bacterium]
MLNLKFFILFFYFTLIFCTFSQKNRFITFFQEVDSTYDDNEAIEKLQKFKEINKLNLTEQIIFNDKIIELSINIQKYSLALKYSLDGLKMAEINKIDSLMSYYTMKIGSSYYFLNKKDKAKDYFYKAYIIAKKSYNWTQEAKTLNNLATIYLESSQYQKAEKYLLKSVEIFRQHGQLYQLGLVPYRLLATLYSDIGKYKEAEKIYLETISHAEKNKDTSMLCYSMMYYADLLSKTNQTKKGISIAYKALGIQNIQQNKTTTIVVYNGLSSLLIKDKQFEKASATLIKLELLKREVFNDDLEKKVAETEVKYKTAKIKQQKELAVAKANAEKRKKNNYILFFLSVLLLIFVFFMTFYYKLQVKRKKMELANQKHIIESVVKAQEDEKRRIARDLHDGICQKFAATKLKFSNININETNEKIKFTESLSLLDESTNELRSISHNIMPPALHQSNLVEAIKQLAAHSFSNQISYSFEVFGTPILFSENEQINIYRISQELFANILKHSKATEVAIQIIFSSSSINLLIEDNGVGIGKQISEGIGLNNMKLRAEIINAKLEFSSGVNAGTTSNLVLVKKM